MKSVRVRNLNTRLSTFLDVEQTYASLRSLKRLPPDGYVARISSNVRSFRALRRLLRDQPTRANVRPVAVQLRPLGGETVWLRPGTSDAQVVWETFVGRYHLAPECLSADQIGLIW